jgi:hypothetical protein
VTLLNPAKWTCAEFIHISLRYVLQKKTEGEHW